ncbi:uncharacterized protein Dwil_GK22701 [Drosophila willistoni]|uniref:Peptidase S1 domain-containing protein n=1 Tax=Drosophila willistoni TaxID=7260 RepID=B4NFT7_DROWI|nr:serine protease 27 [Drosophila willistoni]EDW83154.2 uncharacterized protein Dwil_GK22701 [Drosophila willistoni]
MFVKLVLLIFVIGTVRAVTECGVLDESRLHDNDQTTYPNEYPWVGLLMNQDGGRLTHTRCNVIIIHELHVLTTASCVRKFQKQPRNAAVLLGIYNETHTPDNEFVCNAKGFCVPGPLLFQLADIKINPLADKDTGDNDLAILKLTEPINYTPYILPICLEGATEPDSLTSRNLPFSGFTHSNYLRGKGKAFIVSRQHCNLLTSSKTPWPQNQFCGFPPKTTRFYEATALMGVNVVKDVPENFYLVAILAKMYKSGVVNTMIYQDLRPWRDWIKENIKSS